MGISTSRARRLSAAFALTGVAALTLAACTTTSGGGGGDEGGDEQTITVAVDNAVTSLNSGTPQSNLNTNGMVDYLTGNGQGPGTAFTLDQEFNIVPDETNLTYELLSDDPLSVQYTIADGATWSDGEAMTVDDLVLSWAIGSGHYDDATLDPETGEVTGGTQYFTLAGSTTGLDTTSFPEYDREAGTLTLTYDEPYVDWELVNLIGKPAHVLADKAGVTAQELTEILEAAPAGDPAAPAEPIAELQAVADVWNTGYDITSMPSDESLLVAAGAFVVTDYTANDGGSIVLEPNPEWAGEEVAYDRLILSFINDSNAQVAALRNGEVDIIAPQASADTLAALEDANAVIDQGDQLSYDHLDLSFDSPVFSNPTYREAFLLTVPRQQILDSIVTPINPEAEVLDSQLFVSSQPQYEDATAVNGYDRYTEPDIAAAQELLAGATPEITILYNSENPNRVDSFQLIQASAQEAGFIVNDGGSPDWSSLLGAGGYDASIFGWVSPGAGYAGLPQIWQTGGGGNYNAYSNPEVDALVDQTQTIIDDAEAIDELQIQIDTLTAEDFYGLPLFQAPGLDAHTGRVDGVSYFGGQTGVVWNANSWTIAE
ncbi:MULTISPECIES: ABC transporter family substrate-binding protein [unclassified Agrococcus]|uniref:ABC transporter family substrate-binding protein n=1 Tax=unclassified Agrococcus TaxID=2615065 RepID=UPI00360A52DA